MSLKILVSLLFEWCGVLINNMTLRGIAYMVNKIRCQIYVI